MPDNAGKANILIVDDKPDKLLALESVLLELGQNVVRAGSGRDALRLILRQEFAVILLDINMPGMDGFETAQLIRQHRSSKHTPIIFLTAHEDDVYLQKSYSLGAVDYIMTPFVPEVLRTKVGVFVDLYKATEQVRRQADALRRRASQLHKLTDASLAINAARSVDGILLAVTEAARDIIGAHQAMTTASPGQPGERPRAIVSLSDKYAVWRSLQPAPADELHKLARGRGGTVRLTPEELEGRPGWLAGAEVGGPPSRGLLAAPIIEVDGKVIGLVQLSDKTDGDFTTDDEAILVQLSHLASVAIQNRLHIEAREANRLKDEFLATLSHELRTPLTAILGWTRILRSSSQDPVKVARGLEVIERNANAQARLVEELLDVSRIVTGKLRIEPRSVSLASVVEAAIEAMRPALEAKAISLSSVFEDTSFQVYGDPDRLQQAVWNVLSNAVKFTQKGGRVEIRLRRDRTDVELRVSDSGIGISPEFLPFVFDRFRQADSSSRRAQGGLGIGLALVRHIIELHGGTAEAMSPGAGRGTTIVIKIPATAAVDVRSKLDGLTASLSASRDPRAGAKGLEGLIVLLVDDDSDTREMLKEVLTQHHAQVTAAASVREALDLLTSTRPHVLISDIAMADEDGYDLIRRIRDRRPEEGGDVPALALTAYARTEDRARAVNSGFQMHASKPVDPLELVAAVASLASYDLATRTTRWDREPRPSALPSSASATATPVEGT